ncbi:MAG TPA: phosphonate metabolism protein/1,5-bisphosphokinase (PRPP-forming) PhnN, partial [Gammaproteobacteria bacterium]|nr:phosphonate metabolism protein/1,5-bisphosphokinase (PRPP-forming) PhnN [Gammaproteobacteria bacterium]
RHIDASTQVIFNHRYITRPANAGGENHIELSEQEFENRLKHRCFAMHWHSHGLHYGIGMEVHAWMRSDMNVVVNGSRAYLDQATSLFTDIIPVHVVVSCDVLASRLRARGRENAAEIAERIERARSLETLIHPNLVTINNNDSLDIAGRALIALIR